MLILALSFRNDSKFFLFRSKKSFSKLAPMASSATNAKVIARHADDDGDDSQIYEQHQINIRFNLKA